MPIAVTVVTSKLYKNNMKTVGQFLFRVRSCTPMPLLLIALILGNFEFITFYTGLALIAMGNIIRLSAAGYLGIPSRSLHTQAETIVTAGPYAFVRNPIYIGNILIYLGFSVLSNVFFPYFCLGVLIFFFSVYYCIALYEEDFLMSKFIHYKIYYERVHRFVPKIRGFSSAHFPPQTFDLRKALRSERYTFLAIILVLTAFVGKYCTF